MQFRPDAVQPSRAGQGRVKRPRVGNGDDFTTTKEEGPPFLEALPGPAFCCPDESYAPIIFSTRFVNGLP